MLITDIDINKLNMPNEFRRNFTTALLELSKRLEDNNWDKYLSEEQINGIYEYTFIRFAKDNPRSEKQYEGEVDFENKTLSMPQGELDIDTLKHEILHVLKGQKVKSNIKNQGVKQIYGDSSVKGRALEEYLNEYISGGNGKGAYRDGAQLIELMHIVGGDGIIEASLGNDRTKLEDTFYFKTGNDEFLTDLENSICFIDTANVLSNEVYLLRPTIELIELYDIERRKLLEEGTINREDIESMLQKDEMIREIIRKSPFENYTRMTIDIFDKRSQELYKDNNVLDNIDVLASEKLEKYAQTNLNRDLSHINSVYISDCMNGGQPLYNEYINQLQEMIADGYFSKDESGIKLYMNTINELNKSIGEAVECNKQLLVGFEKFEVSIEDENVYNNSEIVKTHSAFSQYLLGESNVQLESILTMSRGYPTTDIGQYILEDKLLPIMEQIRQKEVIETKKTNAIQNSMYNFLIEDNILKSGIEATKETTRISTINEQRRNIENLYNERTMEKNPEAEYK